MDDSSARRSVDYAHAGFGHRLGAGASPALVVVDPVVAYLRADSPLYAGVETEIEVSATLMEVAHGHGVPVVLTRVEYQAGGVDGGQYFRKVPALAAFVTGSPDGRFSPNLPVLASDLVLIKQYASAFFGTSLASTLRTMGVDTVVVAGLTTSGCVRATAMDALNHGFAPLVVRDAVGDRDPDVQQANLFDLDQKYADVVDSTDIRTLFSGLASRWRPSASGVQRERR